MGGNFPFPVYDAHIYNALRELEALTPQGVEDLRAAMSVLVYRLSKILCAEPPPPASGIEALLTEDIAAHVARSPEGAALGPSLQRAKTLLTKVLELSGWYAVDRVLLRTRPDATDNISPEQHPSLRDINRPESSWARVLPFRPMFCLFGVFSLAFPVLPSARHYDDVPGEDSIMFDGGNDKPKVRQDKQRTFATLLDAVDYKVTHWRSHTKSELAFIGGEPVMSALNQRPRRIGRCYWRKPKGSISPDIIIVKRRHQAPTFENTSHCVDMKFGGDDLGDAQRFRYLDAFPGKLLVLYFPSECMTGEPEEKKQPEWVSTLLALLLFLATRGHGGGRLPGPIPQPRPAPG